MWVGCVELCCGFFCGGLLDCIGVCLRDVDVFVFFVCVVDCV